MHRFTKKHGEMAEWSIAAVLKTVELRGSGGSNPSLSAERSGQNQTITGQKPTSQQLVGFFVSNMSVTKDTKKPQKDTNLCLNRYRFRSGQKR